MKFEAANGVYISNIEIEELRHQMNRLDGVANSFALLEDEHESYIQVGGGPFQFTVESRIYENQTEFIHKKATVKSYVNPSEVQLLIGGNPTTVKQNQILNLSQVTLLFEHFLHNSDFSDSVDWEDITDWFRD